MLEGIVSGLKAGVNAVISYFSGENNTLIPYIGSGNLIDKKELGDGYRLETYYSPEDNNYFIILVQPPIVAAETAASLLERFYSLEEVEKIKESIDSRENFWVVRRKLYDGEHNNIPRKV